MRQKGSGDHALKMKEPKDAKQMFWPNRCVQIMCRKVAAPPAPTPAQVAPPPSPHITIRVRVSDVRAWLYIKQMYPLRRLCSTPQCTPPDTSLPCYEASMNRICKQASKQTNKQTTPCCCQREARHGQIGHLSSLHARTIVGRHSTIESMNLLIMAATLVQHSQPNTQAFTTPGTSPEAHPETQPLTGQH